MNSKDITDSVDSSIAIGSVLFVGSEEIGSRRSGKTLSLQVGSYMDDVATSPLETFE
jgi:hypothetical protein